MFNLLKSKLSNFVDNIAKKISGEKPEDAEKKEFRETLAEEPVAAAIETKRLEEKVEMKEREIQKAKPITPQETAKPSAIIPQILKVETPKIIAPRAAAPQTPAEIAPERKVKEPERIAAEKGIERQVEVKPTILTMLKGIVMRDVTIKEADVKSVIDDFELQLLEADVALPVAEFIREDLRKKLIGKNVKYSELDRFVKDSISQVLFDLLKQDKFNIVSFVKERKKPVKILFLGPNGHGKTTTIAKFVHMLQKNGFSCMISASDTFRAAAIEQTSEHAARLGVDVVKHQYGADPAAVAFDAVRHAEAKGVDVVLIDTAGRQETDRNLVEQLKKISRVVNPDLRLFVVEGIVGNAIVEQVSQFNAAIPLDGVILTKVDCDAKGGTVISIKKATGVPVLYLGVGQGYEDLVPFSDEYIVSMLMT